MIYVEPHEFHTFILINLYINKTKAEKWDKYYEKTTTTNMKNQ